MPPALCENEPTTWTVRCWYLRSFQMILPMLPGTSSELSCEFPLGAFNKNMRRMRVIFNKGVAYDAYLRQKQLP